MVRGSAAQDQLSKLELPKHIFIKQVYSTCTSRQGTSDVLLLISVKSLGIGNILFQQELVREVDPN